jgi:hypothetical protein
VPQCFLLEKTLLLQAQDDCFAKSFVFALPPHPLYHGILGAICEDNFFVEIFVANPFQIVVLCIYRLILRPYSKYPGPFWAKISSWYSLYHIYHKDSHLDILRCHEKYGRLRSGCCFHIPIKLNFSSGDFVRYSPDRLIINRADSLKGKNVPMS